MAPIVFRVVSYRPDVPAATVADRLGVVDVAHPGLEIQHCDPQNRAELRTCLSAPADVLALMAHGGFWMEDGATGSAEDWKMGRLSVGEDDRPTVAELFPRPRPLASGLVVLSVCATTRITKVLLPLAHPGSMRLPKTDDAHDASYFSLLRRIYLVLGADPSLGRDAGKLWSAATGTIRRPGRSTLRAYPSTFDDPSLRAPAA